MGPFYCPADTTAYFDPGFFQDLVDRFGSSGGPLAQEYVVAHEFGHHIQNVLGDLDRAQQDPQGPESGAVRVELQADCYAGLWTRYATTTKDPKTGQPFLEPLTQQDLNDALSAASAVGDDRIQKAATGRVSPEALDARVQRAAAEVVLPGLHAPATSTSATPSAPQPLIAHRCSVSAVLTLEKGTCGAIDERRRRPATFLEGDRPPSSHCEATSVI